VLGRLLGFAYLYIWLRVTCRWRWVGHWWNDPDGGKQKYSQEHLSLYHPKHYSPIGLCNGSNLCCPCSRNWI